MRGEDDEYYMDDDDDDGGSLIIPGDEDSDEGGDSDDIDASQVSGVVGKTDQSAYAGGELSSYEVGLLTIYDNIKALSSKPTDWEQTIFDIVGQVIAANPASTDKRTIQTQTMEALNMQGKSRILSTAYNPSGLMTSDEVDDEYVKTGRSGTSADLNEDARNQVARFIDYLAKRDLSKDNLSNKKRKRRHIPAFIIFLFNAGMYDLIIDCPTMPDLYKREIDNAFKSITKAKLDQVENLAKKYEENGRPAVADKVREMGISWFEREPMEIRTLAAYRDLELTSKDVMLYKESKNKFNNISRTITQDVASKLIAVYQEDGTFETLKDKTRQEAVEEVKALFADWSKSNPIDSEMAQNIIWKKL